MELKEFIKIIRSNIFLFVAVIAIFVLAAFSYFTFRPVSFDTSLTLNITRLGSQKTDQFKYDDFYRLQADEKFAETIVEWIKSPRVEADILAGAGIDASRMSLRQLSRTIRAEKLSSQAIGVRFSASDEKTAQQLSDSVEKVISQNVELLNKNQNDETWFKVLAQNPVTVTDNPSMAIVFLISLALGIFLAFWIVLIKHYLE